MPNSWYVYIIESTDDRLYTGITTDVLRRWREHSGLSNESKKGAKFFRGRKPQSLVFVIASDNRSIASKEEVAIKSLSRKDKLVLISSERNQLDQYLELSNLSINND